MLQLESCSSRFMFVFAGWWRFRTRVSRSLLWGDSVSRTDICLKTLCSPRPTSLCSTRATASAESPGRDRRWEQENVSGSKLNSNTLQNKRIHQSTKWRIDLRKLLILAPEMNLLDWTDQLILLVERDKKQMGTEGGWWSWDKYKGELAYKGRRGCVDWIGRGMYGIHPTEIPLQHPNTAVCVCTCACSVYSLNKYLRKFRTG